MLAAEDEVPERGEVLMSLLYIIPYIKRRRAPDQVPFFFLYITGVYSTVTDFAKLRGWSTLQPRITAM